MDNNIIISVIGFIVAIFDFTRLSRTIEEKANKHRISLDRHLSNSWHNAQHELPNSDELFTFIFCWLCITIVMLFAFHESGTDPIYGMKIYGIILFIFLIPNYWLFIFVFLLMWTLIVTLVTVFLIIFNSPRENILGIIGIILAIVNIAIELN